MSEAFPSVTYPARKGQLCTCLWGGIFLFKSCKHSKFHCLKCCNTFVCQIVLLIITGFTFGFNLLVWKHFAREVCTTTFISIFLLPLHHFFIRHSIEGVWAGVAALYNSLPRWLFQPLYLITQGKQPSAYSTPHSPVCLHWQGIRRVRSSCGTVIFQQNSSVQSAFWRVFIALSLKLLIASCDWNLSFLCEWYISLKLHLTRPLIQSVIHMKEAFSRHPNTEITTSRLRPLTSLYSIFY